MTKAKFNRADFRNRRGYLYTWHASFNCDAKFDPLKSFIQEANRMINEANVALKNEYDELSEALEQSPPEYPTDAFSIMEDDILNLSSYPKVLHYSMYLMAFSLFEHELRNVCLDFQRANVLKLSVDDLDGRNYIDRCRKYVTKVLEVNVQSLDKTWLKIRHYQYIRNRIAHDNGQVREIPKEHMVFIGKTNGIEYDREKKEILIESPIYHDEMIEAFKHYIVGLCELVHGALDLE